jgi:hypothetical protein
MHRSVKLRLEILEDRRLLSVFGNPWPNAERLTLSFAPDGTAIAPYSQQSLGEGYVNSLFGKLASVGTPDAWKTEILRAFQTWAVEANINIGLVNEQGRDFGAPQLVPNTIDSGDIRIGAYPQTAEVIATNSPYNILTGSWAGDVFLNTNYNFSIGGAEGTCDLFSALLDESGNVFGMPDVSEHGAALFGSYEGVKMGLASSDIASIQALYGARAPDAYEGDGGNQTLSTASALTASPWNGDTSKFLAIAEGDITTSSDVDYYSVQTPADATNATVYLHTAGLSLFTGRVTVFDAQGQQVADATSAGPLSNDLTVSVNNLQPNSTYYVRVEKGRDDVFGIGGYELKVGFQFDPAITNTTSAITQVLGDDGFTNESFATATALTTTPGFAANTYYQAYATASGATDQDYYLVHAPAGASRLSVIVQPTLTNHLFSQILVYDAGQNLLPANVLVNGDGGRYVVQVPNVTPGSDYYVLVQPVGRNGNYLSGDYYLTANFREPQVASEGLRQSTLTQANPAEDVTLTVQQSQLSQFILSAQTADASITSGIRMIIYDATGQVVFTVTAEAGRVGTGSVVLLAGTYTVRYEAATKNGEALPALTYSMSFVRVSDPIDPYPTESGQGGTKPPPVVTVNSNDYYASLGLTDPWLNPWQF